MKNRIFLLAMIWLSMALRMASCESFLSRLPEVEPTMEAESQELLPAVELTTEPTMELESQEPLPVENPWELSTEPQEEVQVSLELRIMQDPDIYTYEEMLSDTEIMKNMFPGLFTVESLTQTADGREVLHYVIGSPNAESEIFINGAIHGREYLTAQLVMKQMVVYLQHIVDDEQYEDCSYQEMWQHCAVHVIPMINPDGVAISQFGLYGIWSQDVLETIYQVADMDGQSASGSYLERWKANAGGVDLNRNFDAFWEEYDGSPGHPSADHYKGTMPGSEAEAAALIELTNQSDFWYTINYHAQGRVIYWRFANMDSIESRARSWVNELAAVTGYYPYEDYSIVDPAGYSDWAIYRKQIPSVILEVGLGTCPYISDQFDQIWWENLFVWEITIRRTLMEKGLME